MASIPNLPPPPGAAPDAAPTTPIAAAPAAAVPSTADPGVRLVTEAVAKLREISKTFPQTTPHIAKINELMGDVQRAIMKNATPAEPEAPPT